MELPDIESKGAGDEGLRVWKPAAHNLLHGYNPR